MESELAIVYTGTRVEGLYLAELLKENGIGSIYDDRLQQSVEAGWADGSPEDAVTIKVETEFAEKAEALIKEYFKSRDSK